MLVLAVASMGWAADNAAKSPKPKAQKDSWVTETMMEESATVTAVDQSTRMVTLKGKDGKEHTFKAGDHVRNLPQVQVGDEVKFAYYQALGVRILQKGEAAPPTAESSAMARAKEGEKPGGVVATETMTVATIEAIDKKAKKVTLKGEGGESVTVTPRDPKRLDQVKVGDRIAITITEAVAVKVEKKK
jgi:hypothetical protein